MPDGHDELSVATDDGVTLAGLDDGAPPPGAHPEGRTQAGPAIVLLHGLTATSHYVVMGSRALQRSGHRVIAYDARGHGRSTPARGAAGGRPERSAYGYARLADDLLAVLEHAGVERAVIAGASMGAHTAVRFTLEHPERVAALALVTPAFDPDTSGQEAELAGWDALARGLREGGVEGFLGAYDFSDLPEQLRPTVATVVRQRLSAHEHPDAVADALEAVPRSRPFEDLAQLAAIDVPTLVVASRDEPDPRHPLVVGERYARAIPGARLAVEDEGRSPLAWQGGQLSRAIGELASRVEHDR